MAARTALITGITGQDGSYLAEFLLGKGYRVAGIVRRLSSPNLTNLAGILDRVELFDGDLMDQSSVSRAVEATSPDEVYNLAAQSFVGASFTQPVLTGEITGLGTLRLLEAVRVSAPHARVYHASSSEMFGHVETEPQDESTPFHPRSPYGVAKVYAYWACINYREAYSLFVSNGILFNHESPRRGLEFVTRKITDGVARIATGTSKTLTLGNLEARRDWGYAPDYVDLMWRALQAKEPGDFVGATGESHTVREFVQEAFSAAGIERWEEHLRTDPKFNRPSEVFNLRGNPAKAKRELGWEPTTRFRDLVRIMVTADLERHRKTAR
ncbi:MAG TPA: GDP-mannose 4,6-dehydratase [Thermoplasmata archaeon]|nr:GDP-mannose 4,6-dehydratase [Thermoplasmata archaeon]